MADSYLMKRFLKINGLPIPPQTRAQHTATFKRSPNPPRENIVMPSYYSAAEVQPLNVMQHVPPAWSLPDMEQISYNMLTYSDDLDQLPTYFYNHLQVPAPEMNPSMQPVQPTFPAVPEEMLMHVPRSGSSADTYIQPGLVQLLTYLDDRGQVPSAEMHPAMLPVPPVLFPAENLHNLPENMVLHVPRHSSPEDLFMKQHYATLKRDAVPIQLGLVHLPAYSGHEELPAAEVHRAMQPALPLQQVPPVPQELPVPPPPVWSKREERWTIEEHKSFLRGLRRFDMGDWRSISRIFVPSKTPTQIASHAQKYYLRQTQTTEKKRKSIHDTVLKEEELNRSLLPHHVDHHNHHHGGVATVEEPHQVFHPHN